MTVLIRLQSVSLEIDTAQSTTMATPLSTASATNPICTTTEPAALAPPPAADALELAAVLVDALALDVPVAVARRLVPSSPGESNSISCDVGPGTAKLPTSVSNAVVAVAVGLGLAPSKLASVVASAGVENVSVLLKSAKRDDAWRSSLAVMVYIVVYVIIVYVTVLRAWKTVQ